MKKILMAALLALPCYGHAEVVALNFESLPLVRFAHSTYQAMLNRDFVMSPELLASEKPISVRVRSLDTKELPAFVERVLASQGVKSELRDGVYFLSLVDEKGASGGTPLSLTGAVGAPAHSVDSFRSATPSSVAELAALEREVYRPRNRKAVFIADVLNAAFGVSRPAYAAQDAVVLSASPLELAKVRRLAEELDTVAGNVKLSATFVEVSTNDSSSLGVSVIADVLGAQLGVKLGDTSGGSLTLKAKGFQAVIDALAADGRFKQVAAPTAVVADNEKSNLSFGDAVPTLASTTLDRNGNPIQTVSYQQSGVILSVQPSLLGSGRISVVLDGQVSSFSATTTGVAGSPTLSKRQVQTTVTLQDGELLMIGGLNNNRSVKNSAGFSFLPKSWASSSSANTNTDLVLILSAAVVN